MKVKIPVSGEELRAQPLWAAARLLLRQQEEQFLSHWDKVTRSYREEEIHDLRVASRRLREGLALFAQSLPQPPRKRLARAVKRVTRMLGEVRNADEAFLICTGLGAGESSRCRDQLAELLHGLRRERVQAHALLKEEFGGLDQEPLREDLQEIQRETNLFREGEPDRFVNITLFAAQGILERGERVAGLLPAARREQDGAAQHRLRIAVKKLRYRLEIVGPLLTRDFEELREALKGYQDLLGKLHDLDVFLELVAARLPDDAGRGELLALIRKKRGRLFRSFLERLDGLPVDEIADRIRNAL